MSTSNSSSGKKPTLDTGDKWFSSAGNLENSLDNSNNPSELTTDEHTLISKDQIDPQKHKSSESTYIKPVRGLKDVSPVANNTRTYSTHVKSGSSINGKPKNKNGKSNKVSSGNSFFAKNKKTIIAVVICLLIAGAIILFLNKYKQNNRNSTTENNSAITSNSTNENPDGVQKNTEYTIEYPDVEQYFKDNSSIVSVVSVKDSTTLLSESEAKQLLLSRGFTDYPVTTEYTIEGNIIEAVEISDTSTDKHPIYSTYYINSNNEVWVINVVEGTITASPLSYNLTYKDKTPIIVSESNEIVSYDSSSNQFYKTIPNDTTMDVRSVDRIDADTLDKLTVEDLVDD